jgi:hypothetical protein
MMDGIDIRRAAGAKAKGKRPWFLTDAQSERVLAVAMAVAQELAVTRERLDTIERLLASGATVDATAIDAYRPDAESMAARQRWQADYIARILRVFQQEVEEVERRDNELDTEALAGQFAD